MYCGLNKATPSAARLPVRALPVRQRLSQTCFAIGASLFINDACKHCALTPMPLETSEAVLQGTMLDCLS